MNAPLLELRRIDKSFPGVKALDRVELSLHAGTIHALVGENGAGKSTLIKIMSGLMTPDAGQVFWRGQLMRLRSPLEAQRAGIATIHQELVGFPTLTVAENLLLGERWPRFAWGGVDWRRLHAEARRRLAQFDLSLPTTQPLERLSTAQRQELAIVRAMSRQSRLLILDEPSASLTEPEVARLKQHLRRLRAAGVAILYVSHRLDEVLELSDCVTVLRDGARVAQHDTVNLTTDQLVRDMVGRPVAQFYSREHRSANGDLLLDVRGLAKHGMFEDVTFDLRAGEVVGLGGLVGAGRSEVARAIFGLYPVDDGSMRLAGAPWRPRCPRDAVERGLAYLPEERKRHALVLDEPLVESIGIGVSDQLTRFGMVNRNRLYEYARGAIRDFQIRATGVEQPVGALSGGNQQKSLLARVLGRKPTVVIFDEPTRGVDVGAKAEVHAMIDRLAGQGQGVLLISSDLAELLAMSDRIFVMCEGRVVRQLRGAEMTQENVIRAASGIPPDFTLSADLSIAPGAPPDVRGRRT